MAGLHLVTTGGLSTRGLGNVKRTRTRKRDGLVHVLPPLSYNEWIRMNTYVKGKPKCSYTTEELHLFYDEYLHNYNQEAYKRDTNWS